MFELLEAIISIIKYFGLTIILGFLAYALIYIIIGVFTMN